MWRSRKSKVVSSVQRRAGRVFWLACIYCIAFALPKLQAQRPNVLVPMTNQWRYNASGQNAGSTWRVAAYDDTTANWQTGPGVFGRETDNPLTLPLIMTPLPLTNASNQRIVTYYFRTHFTLTNTPTSVVVVITNLIDDGAIFYLNGTEYQRYNMLSAPAPVTYLTSASASLEATYSSTNLPEGLLVQGDNVLAVEVHNASVTSDDIIFGSIVSVLVPPDGPIVITNQPTAQTIPEGASVGLSVGASGVPKYFQWFKAGSAISGADQATLGFAPATPADSGEYWVRITNQVSSVESDHVILTVLPDHAAPTLLSAERIAPDKILVSFSEIPSAETATNLANYAVTNTTGGLVPIYALSLSQQTNVTLSTAPLLADQNYILIVGGVQDISPQHNSVPAGTAIPVGSWLQLLDEYSFWYFYDPYVSRVPPAPGDDNPDLGSSWRDPAYLVNQGSNDFWGDNEFAPGMFYYNAIPPEQAGTELSPSYSHVVYFRAPMEFPGSPLGATFSLYYLMQDGGRVFVNGNEFGRFNLPGGEVDWTTPALLATNAIWKSAPGLSGLGLRAGPNTVCAELHSFAAPQTSMAFALRLSAHITSLAKGPILITRQPADQSVMEGMPVTFSFTAAGVAWFQWFLNGVAIAGATNALYTLPHAPLNLSGSAFSVLAANESGTSWSSNAVLTVQPDFVVPLLLGAYAVGSNQVLASFSKFIDPVSGGDTGNFALTNSLGSNLPVQSATVTNGTNVLLVVTPSNSSTPYVLVANNVRDITVTGNTIPPNSAVTVGLNVFIPIDAVWKYDQSGTNLGVTWNTVGFDDSLWPSGKGLLYNEGAALPGPKNTLLNLNNAAGQYIYTFYFRDHLALPCPFSNVTLTLRYVLDDGAVFYLNGTELRRFNMGPGLITYTTQASATVGDAVFSILNTFGPTNQLISPDNVLAVEVHQNGTASSDITFGAEISLSAPSVLFPVSIPPRLTLFRTNGLTKISWSGTNATLQTSASLDGGNTLWTDLPVATSPYTIPFTNSAAFYRLKN